MIKSNKEVILKIRETSFLYRKPQKLKIAKNVFREFFSKHLLKIISFLCTSHSAEKTKVASYRRKHQVVVSFKMGYDESKLSFLRTSSNFYSALVILAPRVYVV